MTITQRNLFGPPKVYISIFNGTEGQIPRIVELEINKNNICQDLVTALMQSGEKNQDEFTI